MGRGPWTAPPPARWDTGWQVHLWSILRHPDFSQPAAEEIARGLTSAQLQAVWAATRTFHQGSLTVSQQAATAVLRDELLKAAEASGRRFFDEWIRLLWQATDPTPREDRRGAWVGRTPSRTQGRFRITGAWRTW